MTHTQNAGVELALYLLCKQFNRHAMIFTTKGVWTMWQTSDNESKQEMCEKCDIVLMLIGSGNTRHGEVVVCSTYQGINYLDPDDINPQKKACLKS